MNSLLSVNKFSNQKFFFKIPKIGCKFIGFWPGNDNEINSKKRISIAFFNSSVVLIYCIFQINFCFVHRKNLTVFLDALTPLATQLTIGIKILVVIHQRRALREIIEFLRQSFFNGDDKF
jgi:hypothetical protein